MIPVQVPNSFDPQSSAFPSGGIAPPVPQPTQPMQTPQPPAQGGQQPTQTGQPAPTPQYITTQQVKEMVQSAQLQKMDPKILLNTLVKNGYIIQGLNDQQYNNQQISTGQNQPQEATGEQPTFQGHSFMGNIGATLGNFGVGLVKGAGQSIKAIGQPFVNLLSKGLGASDQAIQQGQQQNTQQFTTHGTAEGIGAGTEHVAEAVGAGGAAEILAPAAATSSLLGRSLVQGGAQGALGFATTNGSLKDRTEAGLGQGALGAIGQPIGEKILAPALSKVFQKAAPLLFRGAEEGGASDVALAAYKSGLKDVNGYQKAFQQEFVNGAKALDEALPKAKVTYDVPGLQELQTNAKAYGVKLPDSVKIDLSSGDTGLDLGKLKGVQVAELNAQDTQKLLTELGKKRMSAGVVNGPVETMINDLHSKATAAFGEDFNTLYSNYSKNAEALKSINDLFGKANTTQTASDVQDNIKTISKLANDKQGKIVLKNTLQDFKSATGIDLTNPTKAIAAANKIKTPWVRQAALGALKLVGFGAAADVLHHIIP